MIYNTNDILSAARMLGIKFDKFTYDDLVTGLNIELEHGTVNPITNVTNDDLILTMKIALAQLWKDFYNPKEPIIRFL